MVNGNLRMLWNAVRWVGFGPHVARNFWKIEGGLGQNLCHFECLRVNLCDVVRYGVRSSSTEAWLDARLDLSRDSYEGKCNAY